MHVGAVLRVPECEGGVWAVYVFVYCVLCGVFLACICGVYGVCVCVWGVCVCVWCVCVCMVCSVYGVCVCVWFTFTFHFHALEKEMATHSSILAWRIPWTEAPGRLQSMGWLTVGHD